MQLFSHLLNQGFKISDGVIRSMQKGQSVDVFQALLYHKRNINFNVFDGAPS